MTADPDYARWQAGLPRLLVRVCQEWELRVDGPGSAGQTAEVYPVRTSDGSRAALKLGWPHPEATHEHLALRAWAGDGAVRLLRASPRDQAMLLERAEPGHDLSVEPVVQACEIIAGLYPRLHRAPIPQLDRLSVHTARWARELTGLRDRSLLPRRFVDQAIGLAETFAGDPATDVALVHSDLHYGNVLAAEREPWLVIDPKPLAGDPAYEVAPVLWNRWAEATADGEPRAAVLERMFTIVDVAGLDEDRVRDWIVVREAVNVLWAMKERSLEHDRVTQATTIIKAVQR